MEEVRTLGGREHTPEATAGGSRVPEPSSESLEQRGMMGGLCFVSSLFLCLLFCLLSLSLCVGETQHGLQHTVVEPS